MDDPTYTFKQPSEQMITLMDIKPNYNITFHRDGKQIGVLDFNGPEMTFTGDADESAKVFFDFIAESFKGRLEQERAARPEHPAPDAYAYAKRLALAIWERHYKDSSPKWEPIDDLMGVLSQIDNMASGLTRMKQPAQQRPCRSCDGTGERSTGIDEAPTSICKPCNGTGQIALAEQGQCMTRLCL